jgi:DNA-binding NtrC family response regulator
MPMKPILILTEDPATRASTQRTLVELGYDVEFRRTPAMAMERVRRRRRPGAVIVDVQLASGGCSTFIKACRREARPAEMPILVMATTPRAAVDAIRAGAQGCVKAPVDSATLVPMLLQVKVPTPN